MIPQMLAAPAAEATRQRPPGEPPGDPPGDFAPVLAQAAQAPREPQAKPRPTDARTATAEGEKSEAAHAEGDHAETGEAADATVAGDAATPAAPTTTPVNGGEPTFALAPTATPAPIGPIEPMPVDTTKPLPPGAPAVATALPAAPAPALQTGPAPVEDGTETWVKAPPGADWQGTPKQVAPPGLPIEAAAGEAGTPVPAAPTAQATATQNATPAPAAPPDGATAAPAAAQPDGAPSEGAATRQQDHPAHRSPEQGESAAARPQAQVTADPVRAAAPAAPPAPAPAHPASAAPAPAPAHPVSEPAGTTAVQPVPVFAPPQQTVAPERPAQIAPDVPVRAHARLNELADTARTVIRMASRDGSTQAHITLHPAELGEVEIRLRYHAGGVSADVLADSRAAAQVLQQATTELRRSLEAQGLVVHDLDVRQGSRDERRALHEQRPHSGGRDSSHDSDDLDQTTIDASSLPVPAGAVDVLA
jgi:flagellar hook-length control protein FliK